MGKQAKPVVKAGWRIFLVLVVLIAATILQVAYGKEGASAQFSGPMPRGDDAPAQLEGSGWVVILSPGGRYVAFNSSSRRLVRGEMNDPLGAWIQGGMVAASPGARASGVAGPSAEYMVTNSTDSGTGSLRWAIQQANSNPGPDTIYFSNAMTGKTISPSSSLPALTDDGTLIDASWNWSGSWPGGKPGITLNGWGAGLDSVGLEISGASNVVILGLTIEGFTTGIKISNGASFNTIGRGASSFGGGRVLVRAIDGNAILIDHSDDNRIVGCYIGTSNAGNLPEPNDYVGVYIWYGKRNSVGGTGALEGNLIGASQHGVAIAGTDAISNTVVNNSIGIGHLDGDIANTYDGVHIGGGATYNGVGGVVYRVGSTIVFSPTMGNAIVGNGYSGVSVVDAGTAYNGVFANDIDDNQRYGIEVGYGASNNGLVGNTIVRNHRSGVYVHQPGTVNNWLDGNWIGTDEYGTAGRGNGHHGVGLYDGSVSTAVSDNVIVSSGWSGVAIVAASTANNSLTGNSIGSGPHGEAMGNAFYGAHVGSPGNSLSRNSIAHNGTVGGSAGVRIESAGATDNDLSQNSIYDNAGAGIELYDQGNGDLPAPTIVSVQCPHITGSGAPAGGRVEIFSDSADEGRYYEGYATADGSGNWVYTGAFRGPNVTATATDATKGTSAFSAPRAGRCSLLYLPFVRR
jgi:hypothetical protein